MKPPEWHQTVLLVANENEVVEKIKSAFGSETNLIVVDDSVKALEQIEKSAIHVLIVDTEASDPKLHYSDERIKISFKELIQVATQSNNGLTVVVLTNKMLLKDGQFVRSSGATLIMDRKSISINRMVYVIRVLRKRTFRTLVLDDLTAGMTFDCDLFHYLPSNNKYALFLSAGMELSKNKFDKIRELDVNQIYVKEQHFSALISYLNSKNIVNSKSQQLAGIRDQLQNFLKRLFDISTDGNLKEGKVSADILVEIVTRVEKIISSYSSATECIEHILYPRWSSLAHGINCAVLAVIFGKHFGIKNYNELAMAAIVHNIGLSEIPQSVIAPVEMQIADTDRAVYFTHPQRGIDILRLKQLPFSKDFEDAILNHHEHYDGSGAPLGLASNLIPQSAALLNIVGAYDHFFSLQGGQKALTPKQAWDALKVAHTKTMFGKKFNPDLIAKIDSIFQ